MPISNRKIHSHALHFCRADRWNIIFKEAPLKTSNNPSSIRRAAHSPSEFSFDRHLRELEYYTRERKYLQFPGQNFYVCALNIGVNCKKTKDEINCLL
jgi:hypothetical protein